MNIEQLIQQNRQRAEAIPAEIEALRAELRALDEENAALDLIRSVPMATLDRVLAAVRGGSAITPGWLWASPAPAPQPTEQATHGEERCGRFVRPWRLRNGTTNMKEYRFLRGIYATAARALKVGSWENDTVWLTEPERLQARHWAQTVYPEARMTGK